MTNFQLMFISSFSVIIPLFFIIINHRQIGRSFHPFVSLIFLNLINETTVWILLGNQIMIVRHIYNVYFLLEAFVITWQFTRWGLFKKTKWVYYVVLSGYPVIWLLDSFYFQGEALNSYFIIFYSFIVILMSLGMLNQIIKLNFNNILLNPVFIISAAFLFFFVYTIITELLSLYPSSTLSFRWNILNLLNTINIICNLAYGLAIFQMRKREGVILSGL